MVSAANHNGENLMLTTIDSITCPSVEFLTRQTGDCKVILLAIYFLFMAILTYIVGCRGVAQLGFFVPVQ